MNLPDVRKPLFERLKAGLEEAIRHANGEIELKTTVVKSPDPPPEVGAEELTKLRVDGRMSREVFARLLNVSTRTVRSWEQGARKPSHATLRLLQVLRRHPGAVFDVAGMTGDPEAVKVVRQAKSTAKTPKKSKSSAKRQSA